MTAGANPPDPIAKVVAAAVAFAEAIRDLLAGPGAPPRPEPPTLPRVQRINLDAGE